MSRRSLSLPAAACATALVLAGCGSDHAAAPPPSTPPAGVITLADRAKARAEAELQRRILGGQASDRHAVEREQRAEAIAFERALARAKKAREAARRATHQERPASD